MPVSIRLTSEQFDYYKEALTKAKVPTTDVGPTISFDKESHPLILAALQLAHAKAHNVKNKNIAHFQRLYNLEHVIIRVAGEAVNFIEIDLDAMQAEEDDLTAMILAANEQEDKEEELV